MSFGLGKRCRLSLIGASMLIVAPMVSAAPSSSGVSFHISAGTLDDALTQVASQSGHQILFDPALVRGLTVGGLQGQMAAEAAVQRLLVHTGLALRIDDKAQWMIVRVAPPPAPAGGRVLGTVRVTTGAERLGNVGANGSSDPLATEGTKSYTTTAAAIASKQPLSLKDTPQSVSVLTRQQLDDRSLNTFDAALAAIPGVTLATTQGGNTASAIYSRGFEVTNVQIDGGSPISIGSTSSFTSKHTIVDDLSAYDSVEIERGAGGQFTGVGSPGGILSLVRKRPLDHAALDAIAQAGSWDRFRGVVDASSPTWLDGLLRARIVLTGERNDEFYDIASRRFLQAYANIEIDPSPTTTINLGTKITHSRTTPFNGLPTDKDGALIDFARDTCYCTDWGRATVNGKEYFAELTQKIGANWSFHLNGSANLQHIRSYFLTYVANLGGIDPDNPFSASANAYDSKNKSNQYLIDGFVTGKVKILGIGLDATLGANFQKVDQKIDGYSNYYYYSDAVAKLLPFSASNFPEPDPADLEPARTSFPTFFQRQYGVYGTLRISPRDWIHLTVGERFTHYAFSQETRFDYGDGDIETSENNSKYNIWSPPNFGLVVDISKKLSAFASYANIFDRSNYYQTDGKLVKPTTGKNAEAGLKSALAGGKLNLSGSFYYIRQINLPQFDPNSSPTLDPNTGASCCYFSDGSKYTSQGVDFQIQGALTRRLNTDLSYVFNDFKYVAGSLGQAYSQVLTQPRHLVKLWAAWQPPIVRDRLLLGAGLHAETSISAFATSYAYTPGVGFVQKTFATPRPGYVTAEMMLKYRLSNAISLQLNVNNLFDKTYYATVRTAYGNYYGTPRSFLLTLHGAL